MLAVFEKFVAQSPEVLTTGDGKTEGTNGASSILEHFSSVKSTAVNVNLDLPGALAYSTEKQNPLFPREVKPMPRVDSQGKVRGANYQVDVHAKKKGPSMP